jgi:hypothetical protein
MSTSAKFKKLEYSDDAQIIFSEYASRQDEPILLAIQYSPSPSESNTIYLFYVVDQIGWNDYGPDEDLFEVEYPRMHQVGVPNAVTSYHVTITNPVECSQALVKKWPKMINIVDAVRQGTFAVLGSSDEGMAILESIKHS